MYGAEPLIGASASESAVIERSSQAALVHLGTHAELVEEKPLESYVALAGDGQNDGRLQVDEVYGLDLEQYPTWSCFTLARPRRGNSIPGTESSA